MLGGGLKPMRTIIEGKLYDTEKSEQLALTTYSDRFSSSVTETLYRSPKVRQLFITKDTSNHLIDYLDQVSFRLVTTEQAIKWLDDNGVPSLKAYRELGVEVEEA